MKKLLSGLIVVMTFAVIVLTTGCKKNESNTDVPVACFTTAKDTVYVNDTVQFTNCSTGADSYLWTFGDTTSSAVAAPTHIFSHAGTRHVTLVATNSTGADTTGKQLTVVPKPVAITSANYVGSYNGSDACTSGNYTYNATIAANGANEILINNFGGFGGSFTVAVQVNGYTLTIPSQNLTFNGGTITISGAGTSNSTFTDLTIQYTILDNGSTDNCTMHLIR